MATSVFFCEKLRIDYFVCVRMKRNMIVFYIIKEKRIYYIPRITRVVNMSNMQEDKYVSRIKVFVKVL